jgi:sec-independent protein translocase protein TatA
MLGLDNPVHLLFLGVLLLLVFGAKRLPEMGRSLGAGMRGFKESVTGEGTQQAELVPPRQGTVAAEERVPVASEARERQA